jgi:hypothetical protein
MMDPIRELKIRAEVLQTRLASGDAESLSRLRALPELRRAGAAALASMAREIHRKHCLAVVARECGFSNWEHARRVLEGDPGEKDLGTLLYGADSRGMLNLWYSVYDEARAVLEMTPDDSGRRYLLAYKRDFFVVDRHFVETLGIAPDDPDWQAIAWDWARPADPDARRRLYCKRLAALRGKR